MRETEFCTHIAHKRECRICGNYNSVYRKYGLFICRRCFKENAGKIGFVKLH
ncbi:Ribosomal protein S29e [Giardia duodenalis]|nr:Ribosomal protein S29e [Giardia intestinalis]8BR8_Sh Chain Sh, Ribosomal protein S29A [Giardia lamblia ATCC 50803]8BRM_Sh Chain Sh, Ribosomal protein S29A [Giardia lamblia ATCC 50803]8BSI_Sh Chain Sh, Ribosomal protein S29A [Giardia intestinalis]8BSJ_Sh Chain Sh, Ribosomal protein S29A [Giardia intestinalis]8BTD_Sh Chain Sh, Ribosomal protein S29A [Giardia lamblia ATCC 50803]8BTR_Sh Chain Sh, Ribosomal protein S29A [Giardia lamblia ATCC 50803]KAE8305448.1 Ribosomal protein S29e [Giardia i